MGIYNNSREIVNGYREKFARNPSEFLQQKVEALSNEVGDYSNKDVGEQPLIVKEQDFISDEELAKLL